MIETTQMPPIDILQTSGIELKDRIINLCQLDIDAVYAYEQAIVAIPEAEIRAQLEIFRDDHVEHVMSLSSALYGMDVVPPTISRDLKGLVIEGMTKLSGLMGTVGALSAMNINEALTNGTYETALSWEMPDGLRELIEKHNEDEKRHKDYIEQTLFTLSPQSQPGGRQKNSIPRAHA
jgi:demethoxyubiquinone hydroxylase (CLK1/Coq7/Cat5 family)